MSDNPDLNMKNEKFCSQLGTYFQKDTWELGARGTRARRLSGWVKGNWRD
jgi:hypothetical protein